MSEAPLFRCIIPHHREVHCAPLATSVPGWDSGQAQKCVPGCSASAAAPAALGTTPTPASRGVGRDLCAGTPGPHKPRGGQEVLQEVHAEPAAGKLFLRQAVRLAEVAQIGGNGVLSGPPIFEGVVISRRWTGTRREILVFGATCHNVTPTCQAIIDLWPPKIGGNRTTHMHPMAGHQRGEGSRRGGGGSVRK